MMLKKALVLFLLVISCWVVCRFVSKPNISDLEGLYVESIVAERKDYQLLFEKDKKDKKENKAFLIGEVSNAIIVDNWFPYKQKEIKKPQELLKVLNDSSSYKWGELGTPYHDKTIIYYNSQSEIIGYTNLDLGGEVDSYPHRSLMKWGLLSDKGYDKLIKEIKN